MGDTIIVMTIMQQILWGLGISVLGGIVDAAHTFSKERKNIPPTFDWVDFVIIALTGLFSGFVGFLIASWWLENIYAILAIAALSSVGGYGLLIQAKDIMLLAFRAKMNALSDDDKRD